MHDIGTFMTWFLNQVYIIFTYTYNTLDSIQFGGISLLVLSLSILILGALIPIFLTLPGGIHSYSSRIGRKEKTKNDK